MFWEDDVKNNITRVIINLFINISSLILVSLISHQKKTLQQ